MQKKKTRSTLTGMTFALASVMFLASVQTGNAREPLSGHPDFWITMGMNVEAIESHILIPTISGEPHETITLGEWMEAIDKNPLTQRIGAQRPPDDSFVFIIKGEKAKIWCIHMRVREGAATPLAWRLGVHQTDPCPGASGWTIFNEDTDMVARVLAAPAGIRPEILAPRTIPRTANPQGKTW